MKSMYTVPSDGTIKKVVVTKDCVIDKSDPDLIKE